MKSERVALNADVVGYSRLVADDFERTTQEMAEVQRLVEAHVSAGNGTLAHFVGDSFMAVFGDAKDAVRTALAIAREIESRNAQIPASRHVRFRMGMDQGEVIEADGQYHGDALNIAARIQAMARPGGLSVSARVYRTLDEPALRFRPRGKQSLKNILEPVEVYDFADLPSDAGAHAERPSLSLESPTVAVLPIHAERVDDSVRAAAAVLRKDLVHRLSEVPQVVVIDAGLAPGGGEAQAAARYMLETGVHQFGENVRVYATLFDVTSMNIVKTHKASGTVAEVFALSDRLAEKVAHTVEVELVIGEPAGLYADLEDPRAIQHVYLGWYHLRTDTKEGWARSLELFGEVARSHPDQPYGHVLSAFANWIGASNEWAADPGATLTLARQQARVAFELGDPTGMSTAVEAAVLMSLGEVEEALAAMDRLEILRPTCDVTYGLEGSVRRYLGDWQQAANLLDVAMRLTGVNKPWYPTVKACSLFMGGRLEEAASLAESVVEYQPHNLEALLVLAAAQSELGMSRRAHATAERIRERFPSVDVEAWIDRKPYQVPEVVDRWKEDLSAAGAIP